MQRPLPAIARSRATRRGALTLAIAVGLSATVALATTAWRTAETRAQLDAAAERLDHLTDGAPADDQSRTAIAWDMRSGCAWDWKARSGSWKPRRVIRA